MSKERLTILLGAGSVCEATEVSTRYITKRVVEACKEYRIVQGRNQSVVDFICEFYWERFGKRDSKYKAYNKADLEDVIKYVNFEDIFHVLELLAGYTLDSNVKQYTSAYKVFTKCRKRFSSVDYLSIISSARKIINVINDTINEYNAQFEEKSGYFKDFLCVLEKNIHLIYLT